MFLKDIQFYLPSTSQRKNTFLAESYAVSYHYLTCFSKLETKDVAKLAIEPTQAKNELRQLLDVVIVSVEFDFKKYDGESALAQKKLLLDLLHNGCIKAATHFHWSLDSFERAFECVKAENYTLKRFWKKPKSNQRRKIKAQLEYEVELKVTTFYAVFFDLTGNETSRRKIHQVKTGWVWINEVLGDFIWQDSNTVALISKDGKQKWTAQVKTSIVDGVQW